MAEERPFWLRPPISILFDLLHLHRLKPWEVNIISLLTSFWREIKEKGFIDFSASGTALLSSAIIHRMKSELVLKMEEPPKPPQPRPDEVVPPPLPFPLRFQYTATSLRDVLASLEEVLRLEMSRTAKTKSVFAVPSIAEELDEFLSNIDRHIEEFWASLSRLYARGQELLFSKVVAGRAVLEVVRSFVMLLFLVQDGRARIAQTEDGRDIRISLV